MAGRLLKNQDLGSGKVFGKKRVNPKKDGGALGYPMESPCFFSIGHQKIRRF